MWSQYRAVSGHGDPEDDVDARGKLMDDAAGAFGSAGQPAAAKKSFWGSFSSQTSPSNRSKGSNLLSSPSSSAAAPASGAATAAAASRVSTISATKTQSQPLFDVGTRSSSSATTAHKASAAPSSNNPAIGDLLCMDDEAPQFSTSVPPMHRTSSASLLDNSSSFDLLGTDGPSGSPRWSADVPSAGRVASTSGRDPLPRSASEPRNVADVGTRPSGAASRLRVGSRSDEAEAVQDGKDDGVETDGSTSQPVLRDFEVEDSIESERRELLIFALPLYRGETVFLPVTTWRDAPTEPLRGVAGGAQKQLGAMKDSVMDKWDSLKDKEHGTLGNKIWRAGQRIAENVSPTERLMRAIPKDVTRIKVFHPTQLSPDEVSERLRQMASDARLKNGAQATVAGLFLPVALTLDLLVIPGIHVLTAYTAWQLGKNASSTIGAQRMATYVAQEGRGTNGVRVDYVPDPRIDKYLDVVQDSVDGVLAEDEIAGLAADLQQDALIEPMLELRARQIRMTATKQGEYSSVPSS